MGSISKDVRLKQRDVAEASVKARIEVLTNAGRSGKDLEQDPILRRAKAALAKAKQRLSAIDAREAHVQKVAADKSQPKKKAGQKAKPAAGGKKKKEGKGGDAKKKKDK
ncbi:MAG: hypothetical protein QNJ97_00935 [Myxococcota bacterium]|nr:hypothetical protein [Myxococcota bacterium]